MLTSAIQPRDGERIVNSLFYLPIAEAPSSRSNGSMHSPDPFTSFGHDKEYLQLVENTRRIRKASHEPKKMDAAWEVYKKLREECHLLCKSLLSKNRE